MLIWASWPALASSAPSAATLVRVIGSPRPVLSDDSSRRYVPAPVVASVPVRMVVAVTPAFMPLMAAARSFSVSVPVSVPGTSRFLLSGVWRVTAPLVTVASRAVGLA